MATFIVTPPGIPTLREAINAAAAGDIILLADGIYTSVRSLAKQTSVAGVVQVSGYAVTGTSEAFTIIKDTRIFQRNVDGAFGPGIVEKLTLDYTAGGLSDGGALLRATSGAFVVRDVTFRGTHTGWNGNGNLYMSLTSFSATAPITADLTLDDVTVSLKGQTGFNPLTGDGSAFLHSWNNSGNVQILDSLFDEAGFLSSFNILNFTGSVAAGSVQISGNKFTRSENQNVRSQGNILGNVAATLSGNTFENGSYLDLYDVSKPITLTANTFSTIANGFGLRITGPTVGVLPVLAGTNVFSGPGLALKYVDAGNNKSISLTGTSTVNGASFTKLTAGGQGNDTLTLAAGFTDWVSGDDGNDSISTGDLNDVLLGGAGNDTLTGGTGNDTVRGGAGNDTINYTVGSDGVDVMDGGGGDFDTLVLTSGAGDQILTVGFDGVAITSVGGGAITDIESITANLGAGTADRLIYGSTAGVVVNLATSTASGFSSIASIENANGGTGDDSLTGGSNNNALNGGLGGNDTLDGAGGNDSLFGGLGVDVLTGGIGNDTFFYDSAADSGTSVATRDIITGFDGAGSAGGDIIHLFSIDANTGAGGNQAFNFIGEAAFSAAGQLRFFKDLTNTITIIEGNTTGATGAEFTIQVNGLHNFLATDFVL